MRMDDSRNRAFTATQRAVIDSNTYPAYFKAGAGTGKTEILVQKEIGLLRDGVGIDEIFTITFTNKAADEMRERLNDRLYWAWLNAAKEEKHDEAKRLRRLVELSGTFQVSTIHGFCEKLLREYGAQIGLSSSFRRDSFYRESQEIIEHLVNEAEPPAAISGAMKYKLTGLVTQILDNCDNRGIVPTSEYLKEHKHDKWVPVKAFILQLCMQARDEIETAKQAANVLTLNDLMSATLRLLQNTYALSKITARCKFLFCDEFQDTNIMQFQIMQALMNVGVNIFLIGDDQQSIYAYRGADITSSQKAHELINAVQQDSGYLNENFRSNPVILQTVNQLFSRTISYLGKRLAFPFFELFVPESIAAKEVCADPYRLMLGATPSEIVKGIIEFDTIDGRPVAYEDIYVLCRSNSQVAAAEKDLRATGLPVITVGGKGYYGKKEIVDIYKLFNAILKPGTVYSKELAFTDYYPAIHFSEMLSIPDFITELDLIFREESIDGILEFIYAKSGIMEYYDYTKNYQAIANLNKLRKIAGEILSREYMQPLGFLDYLHRMIESGAEEDEAEIDEADKKKGAVTVLTVHKAKGLSLPVVIVPNIDRRLINESHLPDFVIDPEKKRFAVNDVFKSGLGTDAEYNDLLNDHVNGMLEEELRVLYVAMTRAQHLLVLATRKGQDTLRMLLTHKDYVSWYSWAK